jgi:predicted choloylglycine hydrolase
MSELREITKNLFFHASSGGFGRIGRVYGEALAERIRERTNLTADLLRKRFSVTRLENALMKLRETFATKFPYLWEEIKGVCAGSGLTVDALTTHLFGPGISAVSMDDEGCSDIIFPRSDVGPLLGKTHDATSPEPGPAVVRLIRSESHHDVLCVTRIDGFSTMTGLNEKGLALGEASIHFHAQNQNGTVRNLLLRPLLHECATVNEAVEFLQKHPPISAGFHFALVDQSGNAAIVERSPVEQNVRRSNDKAIFCTNHTATPSLRALEKSRGKEGDQNSDARFENMQRLTSESDLELSLDSLMTVLTYHDKNGGMCQHGDPDFRGESSSFYPLFTQRAFISIINSKKLLVANGNPCSNELLEFSFN